MSTIINGTTNALTFPDTTVQNTAFTTGAVTQSTIANGVAGTGPAFSYWQSVSQTLSTNTLTKITFTSADFDTTGGMYANSRFTPTVAGYYLITASLCPNASICGISVQINRSGAIVKTVSNNVSISANSGAGSALIYLNGTSDYIEIYGLFTVGQATQALQVSTWFQAGLIRAA